MPPTLFPLRWESTGDQWWFASPIDWAAANGLYDLVRQLLHIDVNLLIKLTSLSRIQRLETVWDDDNEKFNDVAKCRAQVAKNLLHECEADKGYNSLIRAGYGGWLLYTAASAGDVIFVKELLDRDPLLVFGEGEYGVTDMLYAAARSKCWEVFEVVFGYSVSPMGRQKEVSPVYRWEIMNRAVHAAARGGSVVVLRELLGDDSDVLGFRDALGSTVLHTAAGGGQVQVVKYLISSYNIIDSVDDRGNTPLNVAAYCCHISVLKVLTSASPTSASLTNNYGDTFLHMVIAGFRAPSFRRLDLQIELMKALVGGEIMNIDQIINVQNNDGRTALHIAVVENIRSDVVELLLSVRCIDLNVRDCEGNTLLDLLYLLPRSASSEILIKRIISSGGVSGFQDPTARNALVRMHGIGGSPGTSFRIADAEIVSHSEIEEIFRSSCELASTELGYSGEIGPTLATPESNSSKYKKSSSVNAATRRLKILLRWLGKKPNLEDKYSVYSSPRNGPNISLRQQFSRQSFVGNSKRIGSLQGRLPSPSAKKKFRQVLPRSNLGSPLSAFSECSWPSPISIDKRKNTKTKQFNSRLMNDNFCFDANGLAVENTARLD